MQPSGRRAREQLFLVVGRKRSILDCPIAKEEEKVKVLIDSENETPQ